MEFAVAGHLFTGTVEDHAGVEVAPVPALDHAPAVDEDAFPLGLPPRPLGAGPRDLLSGRGILGVAAEMVEHLGE